MLYTARTWRGITSRTCYVYIILRFKTLGLGKRELFGNRNERFLMRRIHSVLVAPQTQGGLTRSLNRIHFLERQIVSPMKRCRFGIPVSTGYAADVYFGVSVKEIDYLGMEIKTEEGEQATHRLVWVEGNVLVSHYSEKGNEIET